MMLELKPYWMSEHLSFNTVYNSEGITFNTNFLLPPRQTQNGISYAIRSIKSMKQDIGIPFAFETGVNYLKILPDELPDGEFIARIARGADCFILLDLHNLIANELNGRQSVKQFLNQTPLERVIEIHIAGGFQYNGYYLDAHSGVSSEALLELTEETASKCPNLKAIIFEMIPEYSSTLKDGELREQFEQIQNIWQKQRISSKRVPITMSINAEKYTEVNYSPSEWEFALGHLVIGRDPRTTLGNKLALDPGIQLMRELLFHFRASMIISTLKLGTRLIRLSLGEMVFENLIKEFMGEYYPEIFPFIVAEQFIHFIKKRGLDVNYLNEVMLFEEAKILTMIDKKSRIVSFDFNPLPLFQALGRSELPSGDLDNLRMEIEIKPDEEVENMTDVFRLQSVLHN
jgi:uncharacterized protein (UPF0276 family)